jgi:DNA gyrase/topoisomerase IV subunit A
LTLLDPAHTVGPLGMADISDEEEEMLLRFEPPTKRRLLSDDSKHTDAKVTNTVTRPRADAALKLLVVKSQGEVLRFLSKHEYQEHAKYVIATHRNIQVRSNDTTTYTVKQRGNIDAEIGEHEDSLGCDELLAILDAARMVAELITSSNNNSLVVVAYRKNGIHGAYLLCKLAWKIVCTQQKKLSGATNVGQPAKWLYSKLWKMLKTQKLDKLAEALEGWYKTHT